MTPSDALPLLTVIERLLPILAGLLQLGWPALVTIFLVVLWRRMQTVEEALHKCLEERAQQIPVVKR